MSEHIPYDDVSWIGRIFFTYISPMMRRARKGLAFGDIDPIPEVDRTQAAFEKFDDRWSKEVEIGRKSAFRAFFGTVLSGFVVSGFLHFILQLMTCLMPSITKEILILLEMPIDLTDDQRNDFYMYAGAFVLCSLIRAFSSIWHTFILRRSGMRMKAAAVSAIYRKAMNLSTEARNELDQGKITNLITVDANRLDQNFVGEIHNLWSAPIVICYVAYQLYDLMGVSALLASIFFVILAPIMVLIGRRFMTIMRNVQKNSDSRVRSVTEFINQMISVKFNVWEEPAVEMIEKTREEELRWVYKFSRNMANIIFLMNLAPVAVPVIGFFLYGFIEDADLTASIAFTALSFFNILQRPISALPRLISGYSNLKVSCGRMQELFLAEEAGDTISTPEDTNLAISINGTFMWKGKEEEEEGSTGGSGRCCCRGGAEQTTDAAEEGELTPFQLAFETIKKVIEDNDGDLECGPVKTAFMDQMVEQGLKREEAGKLIKLLRDAFSDQPNVDFLLTDLDIQVPRGAFIGVVGPVGSGKTSLLRTVTGTMPLISDGKVEVIPSVAFCPQEPYVVNASLRDNILFGNPMDKSWYEETLRRCALSQDLSQLSPSPEVSGDLVEIGDRGITLSGGQKQRVALARALYSDADVYLLDDIISAVDAHVGRHILHFVINELRRRGKTVVLCTHHVYALAEANEIIVLNEGHIAARGSYQSLSESSQLFRTLLDTGESSDSGSSRPASAVETPSMGELPFLSREISYDVPNTTKATSVLCANPEAAEKLNAVNSGAIGDEAIVKESKQVGATTTVEEKATGSVSSSVWTLYLGSAANRGQWFWIIFLFLLGPACSVTQQLMMAEWTDVPAGEDDSIYSYLYMGFGLGNVFFIWTQMSLMAVIGVRASRHVHSELLKKIFRAPMAFFDTTPSGRIINRFSTDTSSLDVQLQMVLSMLFLQLTSTLASIVTLGIVFPQFLISILVLLPLFLWVLHDYRYAARDTRRLLNISRSPTIQHVGESLDGLDSVLCYDMKKIYTVHNDRLIDRYNRILFANGSTICWANLRTDIIGAIIIAVVALFVLFIDVSPGYAGLALSQSQAMTMLLAFFVMVFTDAEASLNGVERIQHYIENCPEEVGQYKEPVPPTGWPHSGSIEFESVVSRYRPELDPVLKGVSFDIRSGEHIGIVGRTGSSKSTLLNALFRIFESEGVIRLDGLDLSSIGSFFVRNSIAAVPQNPALFQATLRQNLDMFENFTDDQCVEALHRASLGDLLEKDGGLLFEIANMGGNLSQGQRQLLALARVLLDDNIQVLVLDEATSSVDRETDNQIQRVLREEFVGKTVLTIAHRLGTIIDYDRILVMSDGSVAEFGTPQELASDGSSILADLIRETGEAEELRLYTIMFGDDLPDHVKSLQLPSFMHIDIPDADEQPGIDIPTPSLIPVEEPSVVDDTVLDSVLAVGPDTQDG